MTVTAVTNPVSPELVANQHAGHEAGHAHADTEVLAALEAMLKGEKIHVFATVETVAVSTYNMGAL